MKITYEQLLLHLKKNLTPIYLITGEESFLVEETKKTIREFVSNQGFQERKILYAEAGFAWENFLAEITQQSLFSQRLLLELHIEATKFTDNAQKALIKYCEQPPQDKILLIVTGKLETKQQYNHWYKQIEKNGVVVQIWPLQGIKLQRWLQQRCQQTGLILDGAGLQLLQEFTEGNLAAAAQAIEKLCLTYPPRMESNECASPKISAAEVAAVIHDSSHFDVFQLVDSALAGNAKRTLTILTNLKEAAAEPSILLWAFARELRNLILLQSTVQQGKSLEQAMTQFKIWESKKAMTQAALKRHSLQHLYQLLQKAAAIDKTIKGASNDNVWLQLSDLCFRFCLPAFGSSFPKEGYDAR